MRLERYKRELFVAAALVALLLIAAALKPQFFAASNLRDIALDNAYVLVAAIGMTIVILARQIDISIGSQLAICGVVAGLLAKSGLPMPLVAAGVMLAGGLMGALNGALVAALRLPSIVVTLATMVALRESLRWTTQGANILGLPDSFQWFGLGQAAGQAVILGIALAVFATFAWAMRNVAAGRAVYAVGSDMEAARLAGIRPARVVFGTFVLMGILTGLAALLSAVRQPQIQTNSGTGFELQVVAAVVVGGTAIAGGRGTLVGTLIGVALLGIITPALRFMEITPAWDKAIQGAIILVAVAIDAVDVSTRRKLAFR